VKHNNPMVMGKPIDSRIMFSEFSALGGVSALNNTAMVAAAAASVSDHHNAVLLLSFMTRYLNEKVIF
jgi:hypothetical protein